MSPSIISKSCDPRGQSKGQDVIKTLHVHAYEIMADLDSYTITFPKTQISATFES